ncbi:hypothetical protein LCGC14_1792440 [marine sediment metagenome]|uniref:Uncharacterized protein n=1 Tax=marine sediment metagenome TaxID=412755 RepID=A0A0F9GS41_9ZZZZ
MAICRPAFSIKGECMLSKTIVDLGFRHEHIREQIGQACVRGELRLKTDRRQGDRRKMTQPGQNRRKNDRRKSSL